MADYYGKLLELRRAEGASRGLARLPSDFYVLARAYLAEVRRTYESELRENPSGRKGELARQTHGRALQIARDLVEARATKILSAAFQAAVGGARDLANGLPEERELFDRIVETLRGFRLAATPYLETAGPAGGPASPAPPATAPAPIAAVGARPAPSPPPPAAAPSASAAVFVRVLKGSPPIELGGETIELRAEDVLSLGAELARILTDGGVAERLEASDPELTAPPR
jgi:DNA replication initiation complex subunit (GINS family)